MLSTEVNSKRVVHGGRVSPSLLFLPFRREPFLPRPWVGSYSPCFRGFLTTHSVSLSCTCSGMCVCGSFVGHLGESNVGHWRGSNVRVPWGVYCRTWGVLTHHNLWCGFLACEGLCVRVHVCVCVCARVYVHLWTAPPQDPPPLLLYCRVAPVSIITRPLHHELA